MSFIRQRLRYSSKIISFYKLAFVSKELKLIMPFLFVINSLMCYSLIALSYEVNIFLFLNIFIKILSDYALIYFCRVKIKQQIDLFHYMILSFLHPFYIIIFSIIGPFINVKWKEN